MKIKKVRVVDLVEKLFGQLPKEAFSKYELVDVAFTKEGKHRYLRVFIDKKGGVGTDDCIKISNALNHVLDKHDPIEEAYILEVSSPGIERPLKKEADFKRFSGKLIQIKLFQPLNGVKVIEGILKGFKDGNVCIIDERTNQQLEIALDKIAASKVLFRFN